jgi:hypothetical protein
MDHVERFFVGTAIAGFVMMVAALVWMAVA